MNPHIIKIIYNKEGFAYLHGRMSHLFMFLGELLIYREKLTPEIKSLPHIIKKKTNSI